MLKPSLLVASAFFALSLAAQAQQPMDADFAAQVKQWTTRPEFSSPLVDHLPTSATVPEPKTILGHHIGEPQKLTYYADVLRYYHALAASSPRVKLIEIGKTEEGRESIIVFIGSEDSIANLETNRKNLARLADPRGLTDAQAKEIIAHTKPFYTLSGGLHSAELGPPEMLMELAYRLTVEDSDLIKKVRENVIVAIMPVADPDGRDRSIDWYNRYQKDITDNNAIFEAGVPYWGKYTKHDDNRDINYAGLANQNLLKWYLDWHPPIMHDLHESVWFLYTFSGQAPQNTLLDPILWGELPFFANYEMSQLTRMGMPGVWTHGYVDGWSPGYVAFMSSNHNGMIRMYEIMGNAGATTMHRFIPETKPELKGGGGGPGGDVTKRQWYRPLPPYKDVMWSLRNNTNYAETGVLTALQLTSTIPGTVLDDFYVKSKNSIHSGETEAPYAFVIPSNQEDMTRVAFVTDILRMQGIEIGRATSEIKVKEGTYPAGSLVVKSNQPYGRLAKTLLGKQTDPDPELQTYDDSAWTMGLMSRTTIAPIADKSILDTPTTPIDHYVAPSNLSGAPPQSSSSIEARANKSGGKSGPHSSAASSSMSGTTAPTFYAVPDHGSPNLVTLRYALKDTDIQIAETPFKSGTTDIPAGSFILAASAFSQLKAAAIPLGLDAIPVTEKPTIATHSAGLPRVAIFSTWSGTQDVGWVRFTFDQYHVPYDLIFKEQVLAGNLASKYDLILIPTQARSSKALVTDIPKSKAPLAYTKTPEFKFLGDYGSSDDITGGMGAQGVAELQRFTESGGLLVTLGASSSLPPDFGITPKIDTSNPTARFYAPGPIVEAEITKPANPIFYGYSAKTIPVRYANGPLFRLDPDQDKADVLMRYPGGDKSVLSGLFNGADEIKGRAAILRTAVGKGEIIMFTTNPIWRWQNVGEFRMMFNTILNYKNLN